MAGIRNVLCEDAVWGEGAGPVCWCDRDVGASTRPKSSSSTVEGQYIVPKTQRNGNRSVTGRQLRTLPIWPQ